MAGINQKRVTRIKLSLRHKGTKKFWIMQYPDASVCAARRNYFQLYIHTPKQVYAYICILYAKNLTPYRLQFMKKQIDE